MNNLCRKLSKVIMFCGLSAIPLCAQIPYGLDFTTSFPFYVGNQYMPAGSYKVTQPFTGSSVLLVRGADRADAATFIDYIPTESSTPAKQGTATFRKYADAAFLASFTVTNDTAGMDFLPDKQETQTALAQHERASNNVVPLEVVNPGN